MDGLDNNRKDPLGWVVDVVMDQIDEDESGEPSRSDVEEILFFSREFLEAAFKEEQLNMPTDAEIVSRVMECF